MARFQVEYPVSTSFRVLVSFPALWIAKNASLMLPVQQPRSFRSDSASILATVKGTPPTPRPSTAPSGISATTFRAIWMSTGEGSL